MPICGQSPDWFVNAQEGKLDYLAKNVAKKQMTFDKRETDPESGVFNGFAAIHYTILSGNLEAFKVLAQYEIMADTKSDVTIVAPGFSPVTKYRLAAGSNVLALALLRKQAEIADHILNLLDADQALAAQFIGRPNQMMLTTYIIATMCKSEQARRVLTHPRYVQSELGQVKQGDITPLFNAAYFGRLQTALVLKELAARDDTRGIVYEMCLQRDNSKKNAIELSMDDKVDLVKFDTTEEDRREIQQIIYELVKEAYQYAKIQQNHAPADEEKLHWKQVIVEFMQGKTENEVFGQGL